MGNRDKSMKNIYISGFSDEICSGFEEQLAYINRLGVGYIEIRGVDGRNISELDDGEVLRVKELLALHSVQVSSIGSPIGKISIRDDFEPHFVQFQRVVKTAKMLDTRYIRMFSFFIPEGEPPEAFRGEVMNRLKRLVDYARREDVVLLHENEKDIYGDNAERCLDIMSQLNCDHFKAVFDFANFVQVEQDTLKAYTQLRPFIEYVHIKDAVEREVVPAGMGEGNVKEILALLRHSGYGGFLSLEPHLSDFGGFSALEKGAAAKRFTDGKFAWAIALNALKSILYDLKW